MCIKLKLQSQRKEVTAMDSNITIEQISDLFDTKITQLKNDLELSLDEKLETKLDVQNLNISGGQRQKIILSRACIHNDTFLLIDEGTSAIDQKATLEILQELIRTPITIIFIAHNFNQDMNKLFDREIHLSSEQ